jgi:hypothetical protein
MSAASPYRCLLLILGAVLLHPAAQLVVGDSPLQLNFQHMTVNGTFRMGTPGCPINSRITVTVPGGDETRGIDVGGRNASYDVHGLMWVSSTAVTPAGVTGPCVHEACTIHMVINIHAWCNHSPLV